MLGLVLATDDGVVHVRPGEAEERHLPGLRFVALDERAGLAIAAAPGRGAWVHRGDGWEQAWEGDARVVRIDERGRCWIGAHPPAIVRSDDGGRSWVDLPNVRSIVRAGLARTAVADAEVVGIVFPQQQLMVGIRPIGTWLSRDGGQSWMRGDQIQLSARSEPLQAEDLGPLLNGLWQHPQRNDRLYAGSRGGFFRSDDGGFTWQRAVAGLDRTRVGGVAVLPGEPDTLLLAVASDDGDGATAEDGAALFRSPNAGASWQRVHLGEEQAWPRMPLVSAVTGGMSMLFVHAGSTAWGSHDGGVRWLPLAEDLPPASAMVAVL